MEIIDKSLQEIRGLLHSVKLDAAEARFADLVSRLNDDDLKQHERAVRAVLGQFLPKRQKRLGAAIEARLGPPVPVTNELVEEFRRRVQEQLRDLSSHHIFQWATAYRDTVWWAFEKVLEYGARTANPERLTQVLEHEIRSHANEIYSKGYRYQTSRATLAGAHQKSVSGLQRFLALPIEAYSERLGNISGHRLTQILRLVASSIIYGILSGYGNASLGHLNGWQMLPRYPRAWAHYFAFLRDSDAVRVIQGIEQGEFREGMQDTVIPVIEALGRYSQDKSIVYYPLPVIGQFNWDRRRLDISLSLPQTADQKKYLEVQCFLNQSFLGRPELEEAYNRGIDVIIGPLKPDVREWVRGHDSLRSTTVDTTLADKVAITTRILDILRFQFARYSGVCAEGMPLTFNFAREFPLKNPFIAQYFRVYRKSVRDLLRVYEGKSGVRLWCSVRRSGKTTACFDLGTSSAHSIVINQTCDHTDQYEGASQFYSAVNDALVAGRPISTNFVQESIEQCAEDAHATGSRVMFVLDEYETLFERLAAAARRDRELRYTIVQPLLNQFVAFSRSNLVVFVGQRPDAHYIIMDQNQLSPYIEQDAFPLFPHVSGNVTSEFRELVRKVLTDRVLFDDGFLDCLHAETGGHPYLTVNLLTDICDWLIAKRRSARALQLTSDDYLIFAEERLTSEALLRSPEYEFFRKVIGGALAGSSRKQEPWLYFVYTIMRRIAQEWSRDMTCSVDWAVGVAKQLQTESYGYDGYEILRTAAKANFLSVAADCVSPRIPLMARLCRITIPRDEW